MDLLALIAEFRSRAGDRGVPPLYPKEDVTAWLNEAEREAAERARLLLDRTTPAVVQIPLLLNTSEYILHPKIFDVLAVKLQRAGDTNRFFPVERDTYGAFMNSVNRRPNRAGWGEWYVVYGEQSGDGEDGKRLLIDRKPDVVGGTIFLDAYRWPLVDMVDDDETPEIGPRHHDGLIDWALHKAYLTRDQEGAARERSAEHYNIFEDRFGKRPDANVQRKQLRHKAPRVRMARW